MIYLKKGQKLFDSPNMVVYDPDGYYNDGDSVTCAPESIPDEPAFRYEAKYIAYGGMVYSISDPEELMKQVLALDPESLFGKNSEEIALNRKVEEIIAEETDKPIEEDIPADEVEEEVPAVEEEEIEEIEEIVPIPDATTSSSTASTTPDSLSNATTISF